MSTCFTSAWQSVAHYLMSLFYVVVCDLTILNTERKKSRMLVTPVFLAVQPTWSYAYFYLRILYIQVDRICYNKYLLKLRQISALWLSSARLRLQPAPRHTWELLQHLLLIDLSWKVNSFPVVWIMFECRKKMFMFHTKEGLSVRLSIYKYVCRDVRNQGSAPCCHPAVP